MFGWVVGIFVMIFFVSGEWIIRLLLLMCESVMFSDLSSFVVFVWSGLVIVKFFKFYEKLKNWFDCVGDLWIECVEVFMDWLEVGWNFVGEW